MELRPPAGTTWWAKPAKPRLDRKNDVARGQRVAASPPAPVSAQSPRFLLQGRAHGFGDKEGTRSKTAFRRSNTDRAWPIRETPGREPRTQRSRRGKRHEPRTAPRQSEGMDVPSIGLRNFPEKKRKTAYIDAGEKNDSKKPFQIAAHVVQTPVSGADFKLPPGRGDLERTAAPSC